MDHGALDGDVRLPQERLPARDTEKLDAGGKAMWKRWIQAYLACVSLVDDQVGKILNALTASPYANNTVVIITSDHGYHMGEKDYVFKDSTWEESTRIPLLVAAPGVGPAAGADCDHPVSLNDPHEWRNLANQSDVANIKGRLRKHLLRLSRQEASP